MRRTVVSVSDAYVTCRGLTAGSSHHNPNGEAYSALPYSTIFRNCLTVVIAKGSNDFIMLTSYQLVQLMAASSTMLGEVVLSQGGIGLLHV